MNRLVLGGHVFAVGRMDELGRMDSPVHRIDPRIQALTTFAFLVAVMSFPRYELSALMPFAFYPLILMAVGGIPLAYILRRLAVAAPLALAVGIFNPLLDRQTVITLGPYGLSGGWLSFLSLTSRFFLTVSAALTLVACTGIHRLCAGLERLGVPRIFVVQVELLYRYLFVISSEGLRMQRAVELRALAGGALRMSTYAALVGSLLLRSMDRAARVYLAMRARGFDGRMRVLQPAVVRFADLVFLVGWLAFFVFARLVNLACWMGDLATGVLA